MLHHVEIGGEQLEDLTKTKNPELYTRGRLSGEDLQMINQPCPELSGYGGDGGYWWY